LASRRGSFGRFYPDKEVPKTILSCGDSDWRIISDEISVNMPAMSWKGVQSWKIGRIIFRAVTYLLITAIFGVIYSTTHAQALTPDLVFSTYLGGAAGSDPLTFAQNTACDALGNIYVTGATQVTDLPVLHAYQSKPAKDSTESAFVAKYNSAGQMLWCTYLGGNNQSMGIGVAATPNGGVAVTGITTSNASGPFPTTPNAFQSHNNGQSDYFVTVFDAKGNLQYSTYLGGSGVEGGVGGTPGQIIFTDNSNNGNCVAVDANGRVYVGGMTTSGGGSGQTKFPVTDKTALQKDFAGSRDASLSILDPSKSGAASLVYSSFLGGDHDNQAHSVAVDPSGRYIAVGGFTTSSTFPTTTNAYRSTAPSGGFGPNSSNGFITQFQSSQPGSPSSQYTMRYSTYLGANSSTARDDVYGMTMDASGNIVATGRTQSSGFPMTKGGPTIFNKAPYLQEGVSGDEPYLVKINPSLNGTASLVYSTFLGGGSASKQWGSWSTSVAVDARGAVYVGGETDAQGAPYVPSNLTAPQTFPYTPNAFLQAPQGSEDAMLMQINPSGDNLDYSTYLGGTLSDRTYGLAVDPDGNVVMTGLTFSSNFPLQNPAQTWPGNTNYQNAFVTEFSPLYAPFNLVIDNGVTYPVTGDITYDNEYIGQNSTGTLTQGGSTNTVNNNLKLGQNAGASGTYNLSGGTLSVGGNEYVGYSDTGSFTQTGGTHTVTGILMLAAKDGSSGTYNLSGGTLSVGAYEAVGYSGTGTFTQSGGTHTGTALYLGTAAGASGTYNLSGGTLSVGGNEYVGIFGSGAFNQNSGTHTISGDLYLAANSGSSGTYSLSGGSLSAGTITLNSGGTFTQSGGILSISSDSDPGGGTLNINGGTLQASGSPHILGNDLKVGGDFALGGTNNFTLSGAVDLGGPTRTITLTNSGDTNLSGIISNGGLSIDNTGAGSLTLSGANTYTGTTTLNSGTLLAGSNEAFNATGGANLIIKGGTIGASAAGISITNPLTIGGDFNMGGAAGTALEFTKTMNLTGFLLTHNGASDDTLKGNLTSTATGGVTTTAGTLNLTGNNVAYAGTSTVTGGILNLQGTGNYGGNNTVNGGILNLNSASVITYSGINTVTGGTLNMSSAGSTYSGASTLSSGRLNLSAGTLSGLLTLNGGTFNLSGTGAYTNAAPLTNSADTTLNIAPGSTLTLTGGLTNNGNTDVNGNLTGNLTNNAGGLVNGSGVITGTLMNNGRVNPGNSPGTLSVVGSYVQTAAGTYTAEIASASSYDRINVTGAPGTATLAGAITPTLYGGFKPRGNQVFPGVIATTGGITGTFSTILNQQLSPTLFWQARYNPTSVDLWVQRNYTNAGLSLNSNQLAVGTMLNSVAGVTSGDLDNVLNAIDYLPDSGSVQNAFKQISPEKAGALTNLGFVAANFQMRNLATRTTNLRFVQGESGGSSLSAGGLSFSYSKLDGLMLAYNGASLSNLFSARKEFQAPESRWGLYLDGGAAFGSQKSSLNQTGYNFTLGGFTAGADYRLRDNLLLGLSTGYSNTSSGFHGSGGSVNANTVPFNAYAAYFPGSLYAYGSLGYALNLYDLKRGINFGGLARTASSSTTGNQFNLYGETGYDLKLSRFILTPSATLAYSALWVGGFTEQGAGALNLKVAAQNANSVQTGVGGRLTVPLKVGSMKLVPQGYAFYQHEFANGSRNLNASLSQGSSSFSFQTDAAKPNFALVGASVTAGLRKNLYAQVNFNAELGRTGSTAQFINTGLRYEF
jgi:autotransporter-associated beta strand protein